MIRGLFKAAVQTAFGRAPGGTRAYRTITREWMGTQATHTDKLQRVWPEYVGVWGARGVTLPGADVWIYEGGMTPFPSFANFLVTGSGGVVTNRSNRVLDRYLARAVNAAATCALPGTPELAARRERVEALRWSASAREAIATVGGRLVEGAPPGRIPLDDASIDLCHSGGVLEHQDPRDIAAFLREARRILRPGAVMSHVVDHRDHLHHADPTWPYLAHYRFSPRAHAALFGHPLGFHNRLLPGQVRALFERAGFERIAVRRMLLPSHAYVETDEEAMAGEPGIERARLHPAFRAATDADLRTAAAHYLYRVPA